MYQRKWQRRKMANRKNLLHHWTPQSAPCIVCALNQRLVDNQMQNEQPNARITNILQITTGDHEKNKVGNGITESQSAIGREDEWIPLRRHRRLEPQRPVFCQVGRIRRPQCQTPCTLFTHEPTRFRYRYILKDKKGAVCSFVVVLAIPGRIRLDQHCLTLQ